MTSTARTTPPRAARKAAAGPASDEPFTYVASDGTTITVPSLAVAEGAPNPLALAEAREANDTLLTTLLVVRAKTEPAVFDQLKRLPADEFNDFAEQWAQHSGVTPGK